MKTKIIRCDVCGKNITSSDIKYKFKKYKNSYVNNEDFEFMKWSRMDMCDNCFRRFQRFCMTDAPKEVG